MQVTAGGILMFGKVIGVKAPKGFIYFFNHKINVIKKIKILLHNEF